MDTSLGHKSRIYYSGYGYSKRRCESVTTWFINKFLPRHQIDITVNHRGMIREDAMGYCDWIGTSYNPRDFEIELQSNMDEETYIKTLLHELVHLRQWVKGTLKMKSGKFVWKGEDIHHIDYMNQPHEIEAFSEEKTLYNKYAFDKWGVWLDNSYFNNRLPRHLL